MVSERRAFGERLRRHRERKRITLEAISQATKVPASLFASLERGDCSRWPAAIYARAYVRGYAEAVGLHATDTVEDFVAAFYPPVLAAEDGETAPVRPPRGTLRLSLAEASLIQSDDVARRVALAAADLLLGCLIAAVAHVGLGAGVWVTVGCTLAYFTIGRVVSNDPLLYRAFQRGRTAPGRRRAQATPEDVTVAETARTVA
jgi:cytoskeletal protein RodZ